MTKKVRTPPNVASSRVELMEDPGEFVRALGNAAAVIRGVGRAGRVAVVARHRPHREELRADRTRRSLTSALASASVKISDVMSLTPIIGVMPSFVLERPRLSSCCSVARAASMASSPICPLLSTDSAVVHGHDVHEVDAHAVSQGSLHHAETAGIEPGRQHRQGKRHLEVGIGGLQSDECLVAQGKRCLVLLGGALDVEVDRPDVIAVDHRLILCLQHAGVGRGEGGFLPGRAAERDRDVAAGRLNCLHLLEDRAAVDERVVADRTLALPANSLLEDNMKAKVKFSMPEACEIAAGRRRPSGPCRCRARRHVPPNCPKSPCCR